MKYFCFAVCVFWHFSLLPTVSQAAGLGAAVGSALTHASYYGELILPDLRVEVPTWGEPIDGRAQLTLSVPLLLPRDTLQGS